MGPLQWFGAALVAAVVVIAILWSWAHLLAQQLYARIERRRPDHAWRPTGVRPSFTTYDKQLQERGRVEALKRQAGQRRAAARVTSERGVVLDFESRRSER